MKYELVKINDLSGKYASIYTIKIDGEESTLLGKFIADHQGTYKDDVGEILSKLEAIGKDFGARKSLFKEHEGKGGDLVVALYDDPDKNLRLYGIKYSKCLLVVGDGGVKKVRALQDDERLKETNYFIRQVSDDIAKKMQEKEMRFSNDDLDFEGDLTIDTESL